MKNRAFKKWLVMHGKDIEGIARLILIALSEQGPIAFELMDESDAPFTMNGYKKAAKFVIDEVKSEIKCLK